MPIGPGSTARRLGFWFVHYLPLAVRRGRLRDQNKVALEMWNALGQLEGVWPEPQPTRREAAIAASVLGIDAGEYSLQNPFASAANLPPALPSAWDKLLPGSASPSS